MNLLITTNDVKTANGYTASVAKAFQFKFPELTDIQVHNNRVTASRQGYPVRFLVTNFTPKIYRDLMYGTIGVASCTLKALPVPMNSLQISNA